MSLDPVTNFAKTTLASGITLGATSMTFASGGAAKFPDPDTDGAFNVVIWNSTDYPDPADDPEHEIVRVTSSSGEDMTITRAQEGTATAAHNANGKTYSVILAVTKKMIEDVGSLVSVVVPSGSMNGVNTSFTIPTGKTLLLLVHNRMVLIEGAQWDFTYSEPTITYAYPPAETDKHYALVI